MSNRTQPLCYDSIVPFLRNVLALQLFRHCFINIYLSSIDEVEEELDDCDEDLDEGCDEDHDEDLIKVNYSFCIRSKL